MRYPIIKVKTLPPHYKHCMIVRCAYFKFEKEDVFCAADNEVMRRAYLKLIKKEITEAINQQFITCQGEKVISQGKEFMVFKSNFDSRMFDLFVSNLFKEVSEYVNSEIDFYYAVMDAMIYLEGREPSLLGSMKMGEDIFNGSTYEAAFKKVDVSFSRGHAKYLTSLNEFAVSYQAEADNYCI
ncbi:MAG: hypothetical protein PHQ89_05625 [Bacilli bacterium]|nr:hypothetical protein [Bacilli bacterium]